MLWWLWRYSRWSRRLLLLIQFTLILFFQYTSGNCNILVNINKFIRKNIYKQILCRKYNKSSLEGCMSFGQILTKWYLIEWDFDRMRIWQNDTTPITITKLQLQYIAFGRMRNTHLENVCWIVTKFSLIFGGCMAMRIY